MFNSIYVPDNIDDTKNGMLAYVDSLKFIDFMLIPYLDNDKVIQYRLYPISDPVGLWKSADGEFFRADPVSDKCL